MIEKSIKEIAHELGAQIEGDANAIIRSVAGLKEAQAGDISFLANKKYGGLMTETKATAVIVDTEWTGDTNSTLLRVDSPDAAFAKVAMRFTPPAPEIKAEVHETAIIGKNVSLGKDVHIGPYAVINEGSSVGDGSVIHAHTYIGQSSQIGAEVILYPYVSLREYSQLGDRVIIHNGSVVGSDGFGYTVNEDGSRTKVPQRGCVVIGNDVEIGANVTIDRARFGKTRIGNGVKIDNLVQIAHNVLIEDNAVIVAQAGISGSTIIGEKAILAGQVGVAGHLKVGAGTTVGAQGGVTKDTAENAYLWGTPAMPFQEYSKLNASMRRLPQLKAKVQELEAALEALKEIANKP